MGYAMVCRGAAKPWSDELCVSDSLSCWSSVSERIRMRGNEISRVSTTFLLVVSKILWRIKYIYKYGRRNDIRKLIEQRLAINVRIWLVDAHFDFNLATSLISYSVGCPFANVFATIRRELRRICHLFVTNLLMEASSVFRRLDVNHLPG